VSAWTGDDPHLNTMISPNLTEIGAGVAEAGGVTYYVIDAARPTTSGVPQAYTPGAEAALNGGQDIIIPVAISTPDKNGDLYHEVQAGQSLWAIAISYGVKIKDIQQLNSLGQQTVIQRGIKLLVKRVGTATPAPPTETPTDVIDSPTPPPTAIVASPTLEPTPTPVPAVAAGGLGPGAAVGGIAVVALIAAGVVAWAGRSKPS
ncbi:MAG: LysM peptidoglycan-binding domain-containing protein, partial [Anaerolineae bacterium]